MQNACLIKKANIAIFYLLILLLYNACKQAIILLCLFSCYRLNPVAVPVIAAGNCLQNSAV